MRIISLILMLFFLNLGTSYSYEVSGVFKNLSEDISVIEGESFDAEINIWPMLDENLETIKNNLLSKTFLDYFYIVKVNGIKFSENNSEVVVVYVKAVLTKSYENKSVFLWNYKSLTIPFEVKNITPIKNNLEKNFIIMNQENGVVEKAISYLPIIIFVLIISIVTFFGRKFFLSKRKKDERKKVFEKWDRKFKSTNNRLDIEEVYKKRTEWLSLVGGETPPILDFFNELDNIQYKENWTDVEQHKVLEAFDEIRGIFERN